MCNTTGLPSQADFNRSRSDVVDGPEPDSCTAAKIVRLIDALIAAVRAGELD
jgi:hypothetical protein